MDGIQTYGYDLKMMVFYEQAAHAWTNLRVSTLRYKAMLIILQETESTRRNHARHAHLKVDATNLMT